MFNMTANMILRVKISMFFMVCGQQRNLPSSRTSIMAIFEGEVEASRFEEARERSIWERSVEESLGRFTIV